MKKQSDALELACSKDPMRKPFLRPFTIGGWNIATDAHIILALKGDPLPIEVTASQNDQDLILRYVDHGTPNPIEGVITADQIRAAMEGWPEEDDFNEIDCEDCEGHGEVECTCWECDNDHMAKCKKCNGEGTVKSTIPVGKMHSLVPLCVGGFAYFGTFTFPRFAEITELLGVKEWKVTHGSPDTALRVEAEGAVVILMPIMSNGLDPFVTIPIK